MSFLLFARVLLFVWCAPAPNAEGELLQYAYFDLANISVVGIHSAL